MRPPSSLAALAALGLASALAAAPPASAQTPEAKRPRICLVLSGGGARGAAHVGVLKVLEEMRVPIDCIAGTSMGSIVGGAFASGVTVAEMEETLGAMSTERLFKERPPRQERSIRRKTDDFTILFTPEVGLRDGAFQLPKGIVSGVQLETVLRALAKAQGYRQFDELPIPFRAVATDLVTGTPVVFSAGELANVMRASMSVPGLIDPAEIGGKLLVDGGLTDNLPVGVARAMGADVVIAVNLGTPLMKREELNSIFGVTGQMINILTEQNVRASLASLKPTDILILPELGDFSAADFDHLLKTIPIGEAAARTVADRLSAFSLPPAEYAALRERQLAVAPPDLRPVDEIRFPGLTRVNPAVVEAEMETRPGQPIDQTTLDRDMQRLYGTDDFEHVSYRIIEETGKRVLSVDALEKSWGPNYLRFGLGLTSDFKGDAYYNLLASYRKTWINSLGAEWRTDLQVGRTSRAFTEFYQPLDTRQYFFVAPYADAERRQLAIFNNDQRLAIFNLNYGRVGLDVGSQFTRYGELRLGLLTGSVRATVDTGPTFLEPDPNRANQGAIRGRLFFDQLDNVNFPRSGYGGTLDIFNSQTALGASVNYTKWTLDGTAAHSFGDHTFNLGLRLGGKIGADPLPVYDQFNWGGFLQQSGYRTGALLGQSIEFARLVYLNRLARFTL
ncbi:MAG TPA: patatin-like phospholipase family protein, partial [Burkholderiales bacterium]|nr:patatin-like phospholipase family protein [Burkholderiales bacterium]